MSLDSVFAYFKRVIEALKGNLPAGKHLFKSKTFWVNFLSLLVTFSGYMSPKWTAVILPLANIGLRIVTTQGITFFEE